jgi:hypothetical protein
MLVFQGESEAIRIFEIQMHKNDEMTFFRRERERVGSLDEMILHWLG